MTPSQPGRAGKYLLTKENKSCALLSCHKNKGLFFPSDKACSSQFLTVADQQISAFLLQFLKTLAILATQHFIAVVVSCAADLGHGCSSCLLTQPTNCSGVYLADGADFIQLVNRLHICFPMPLPYAWVQPLTCLNISQMLILSKAMLI